jgi:hypothetical protein
MDARSSDETELSWKLVYTKPRAEAWAEMNLRKQGYRVLLPRVAGRRGFGPLFPRYLFVGHDANQRSASVANTYGVLYVVQCGQRPAYVPQGVIDDIRTRMNQRGVVFVDDASPQDSLFARRERDRVRTLVRLAQAGFRVRSA